MTKWYACLVLVACGVDAPDETDFWVETTTDDGDDSAALGRDRTGSVAIAPGRIDSAELVKELPVGQSESSANHRTVLEVNLPPTKAGDRVIVPVEVQATVRCDIGQTAPGCNYNPTIRARLVVGGKAIATQTQSCTHDEHHCMFVFTPSEATTTLDRAANTAHVEMWAWDSHARGGGADKVIIGGNDGDYLANGKVDQDVARIMAVRERDITADDRARRETSGGGDKSINTNANPELVYSHRIDPKPGEQYLVEAKLDLSTGGRARVSAEMFLSHDPNGLDGGRIDKISPPQIGEQNGVNCRGSCTLKKVAVFAIDDAIAGPLYVNVVVKSAVPGGGPTNVTAHRNAGFVRSIRYAAALR